MTAQIEKQIVVTGRHTEQHTVTITKSNNNPWWSIEPNTAGAMVFSHYLTEAECRREVERLGYTQVVSGSWSE